ncbi:hypothetical protein [Caldimonas sp. KR1-144]|uniref:hypothetical protein n=1 Tax=Caldimonas sp. KR1-144 TaxID=3400911 RepID=UPI003BFEC885
MRTTVATQAPNGVLGQLPSASVDLMHRAGDAVRDEARALSTRTQQYVQDEPLKSLMIATAFGAMLTGLIALGALMMRRH